MTTYMTKNVIDVNTRWQHLIHTKLSVYLLNHSVQYNYNYGNISDILLHNLYCYFVEEKQQYSNQN